MAETEVESILREIRERVLSQQRAGQDAGTAAPSAAYETSNGANGANDSGIARSGDSQNLAAENLEIIDSYLTTTARAWDRLPPLVSNRSGLVASLELWLKRRLRAGTRWFTWEQVNFNAAVHHALRDLLPVLLAYEQELAKLRAEGTGLRAEVMGLRAEVTGLRAEGTGLRAEITGEAAARRVESEQHAPRAEMNARLTELVSELRERDERMQNQQRICFKQLSLETSEAAVLEDRGRRKTAALLEELGRRIEQLEKGKE